MKYFFASTLILCIAYAKSQSVGVGDSLDIYINRLGWHSSGIAWTYIPKIALYEDAKMLVAIKDTRKIPKLINSLGDSSKTVVVHLILSLLVEPENGSIQWKYNYGKDGEIVSADYVYNGLEWLWDTSGNSIVSRGEIDKVERYWRQRCHQTKPESVKISLTNER
jgi:hypothetical protein